MYGHLKLQLQTTLSDIEKNGLFKRERIITSPMDAVIKVNGNDVLVFCGNNYLGLSSHPKVIEGAKNALDTHGFGMSSVRFICGTQDIHKQLE
jgi:glycine C-acetyltransferase